MSPSHKEQVAFLINVLKNTKTVSADFEQVAQDMGMTDARDAKDHFKEIVESSGEYSYQDGKVFAVGASNTTTHPKIPPELVALATRMAPKAPGPPGGLAKPNPLQGPPPEDIVMGPSKRKINESAYDDAGPPPDKDGNPVRM